MLYLYPIFWISLLPSVVVYICNLKKKTTCHALCPSFDSFHSTHIGSSVHFGLFFFLGVPQFSDGQLQTVLLFVLAFEFSGDFTDLSLVPFCLSPQIRRLSPERVQLRTERGQPLLFVSER